MFTPLQRKILFDEDDLEETGDISYDEFRNSYHDAGLSDPRVRKSRKSIKGAKGKQLSHSHSDAELKHQSSMDSLTAGVKGHRGGVSTDDYGADGRKHHDGVQHAVS